MSEAEAKPELVPGSPEGIVAKTPAEPVAAAAPKKPAKPQKRPARKAPAPKKPAVKRAAAKVAAKQAAKPDEDTRPVRSKRPSEYVVKDETHYSQVADKFNYPNYRELGAFNGVHNSRYDLVRGQVVRFPIKPLPGT